KTPLFEVAEPDLPCLLPRQLRIVKPCCKTECILYRLNLAEPFGRRVPVRNGYARAFREHAHRLGVADVLDFRNKLKDVSPFPTTETLENGERRVYAERRSLFVVKRAQSEVVRPLTPHPDVIAHHLDDVRRGVNLLDDFFRYVHNSFATTAWSTHQS